MLSLKTISLLIIGIQLMLGLYNKNWGIGMFVFIFIVFPSSMPFLNFFSLNILRSSLLICIITMVIKDNLLFNLNCVFKNGTRLLKILLIFSALMLPSFTITQYSEGFFRGVYLFLSYFILNAFVPGLIIIACIRDKKDFEVVLKWVVFAVIFMTVYGLVEYIRNENPFIELLKKYYLNSNQQIFEYIDQNRLGFSRRIQSFCWHSIAYGGYLSLLLSPILLPLIYREVRLSLKYSSFFLLLIFGLLLANIFLSLSRSSWLSGFLILFFVFSSNKVHFLKHILLKQIIIVLLPLILFLTYLLFNKMSNIEFSGSSLEMRIEQFNSIKPLLLNSGVFGHGPGAIAYYLYNETNPDALGYESILISYPINYGLAGLIAFVFIYWLTYSKMNAPKKSGLSPFFNSILVGHIVFIVLTGEMDTFRIFWLVFSLLFVAHKNGFYNLELG